MESSDSRHEEAVEASAMSGELAAGPPAATSTAHPHSAANWGSSATDAWLARFSQRMAKHTRENQGPSTEKWRPFVLREALEKAAAELPARTKLGDLVLGKVVALAKWKSRARKMAEAHGFKMSTQRPHFQKLREVTARRGAVVGSALEHSGIDPHVDLVMQDSSVDLDRRLADAATKHKQSLTPMHVIHARVKFASKGVTRWEAGQQTVADDAGEETEEEETEEAEDEEEEEEAEALEEHGESQLDHQPRRPWSASDLAGITEALSLGQADPGGCSDSGACSDEGVAALSADEHVPWRRQMRAERGHSRSHSPAMGAANAAGGSRSHSRVGAPAPRARSRLLAAAGSTSAAHRAEAASRCSTAAGDEADRVFPQQQARSRRVSSGSDGDAEGGGHGGLWLPSHGGARSQLYEPLYDGPYEQAPPPDHQHADASRLRRHGHDSSKHLMVVDKDSDTSPQHGGASTAAPAAGRAHVSGRRSRGGPRTTASSRRELQDGSTSAESDGEEPAEQRPAESVEGSGRAGALGSSSEQREPLDLAGTPETAAAAAAVATPEAPLADLCVSMPTSSGPHTCTSRDSGPAACMESGPAEPRPASKPDQQDVAVTETGTATATAPLAKPCDDADVADAARHAMLLILPEGALDMDGLQHQGQEEAVDGSSEPSGVSRGSTLSRASAPLATADGMVLSPFGMAAPPESYSSTARPPQLRALGRSISGNGPYAAESSVMLPPAGGSWVAPMPPPSKSNQFVCVAALDSFPSRNQPVRLLGAAFNGLVGRGVAGAGCAAPPGGTPRSISPGPAATGGSSNIGGGLPTRSTLSGTLPVLSRPSGDGSAAQGVVGHAMAGGAFAGVVFGSGGGGRGAVSTNGLMSLALPPQPLSPSPRNASRPSRAGMGLNVQDMKFGGVVAGGRAAPGAAGPPAAGRQPQQLHSTITPRTIRRAFRASDGFAAMGGGMAAAGSAAWAAGTGYSSAELVAAQRLLPADVWGATGGGGSDGAAELLSPLQHHQQQQLQSPQAEGACAPWLERTPFDHVALQEDLCALGPFGGGAEEAPFAAALLDSPSISSASVDQLPQLLVRASLPNKGKGAGSSGPMPGLALPPRLSLTPRASEVSVRGSQGYPQPSWPLSPSAAPLSPGALLTSSNTAASFEPGPLSTDRTQLWQRMQAIAASQGRSPSSAVSAAGQSPASPSGAAPLAGTTSGKALGRQQRRLAAGLLGAAAATAAAAAVAASEGGAAAAGAAAAAATRSAKSFVGMRPEDRDALRRSSSLGMGNFPHVPSGELPNPHSLLASPRTSTIGASPAAPGWGGGTGAGAGPGLGSSCVDGAGHSSSVWQSCGGVSGELLPRLSVEPQLPPAVLQPPQPPLQLPSPSSPRHAAHHAPASPAGLRQSASYSAASPRSPQLPSPHRSHHLPLQQQQHQQQLRHQHSHPSRLSGSDLSAISTAAGGSTSSQQVCYAVASVGSPPASISGVSPLSPSSSITSTVSVTIAPRNLMSGASCTLPALGAAAALGSPVAGGKRLGDKVDATVADAGRSRW